jgi:hypothetical protein
MRITEKLPSLSVHSFLPLAFSTSTCAAVSVVAPYRTAHLESASFAKARSCSGSTLAKVVDAFFMAE